MEVLWALVKDGIVKNVIVCDPENIGLFDGGYDHVIRYDNRENKAILGGTYNAETDTFSAPE